MQNIKFVVHPEDLPMKAKIKYAEMTTSSRGWKVINVWFCLVNNGSETDFVKAYCLNDDNDIVILSGEDNRVYRTTLEIGVFDDLEKVCGIEFEIKGYRNQWEYENK